MDQQMYQKVVSLNINFKTIYYEEGNDERSPYFSNCCRLHYDWL